MLIQIHMPYQRVFEDIEEAKQFKEKKEIEGYNVVAGKFTFASVNAIKQAIVVERYKVVYYKPDKNGE